MPFQKVSRGRPVELEFPEWTVEKVILLEAEVVRGNTFTMTEVMTP
jgi:hypothetical protein